MRIFSIVAKFGLAFIVITVISVTTAYLYFAGGLPKLSSLSAYQPPLVSRVYNTHGELVAEFADEHRILTPLADIPKRLIHAFLAAEDEHFYQHPGINPFRIIAAAIANIRAGHTVQGGSTITQQVAKNFLLSSERTYTRKIREVILAYRIEQNFSKDGILYLYLNHIYLGRGSYGIASAAWRYFNKRLDELTLAECAMLAGLPKAPATYAPHIKPELALARRNTVLRMMEKSGLASDDEVEKALQEPLTVAPLPEPSLSNAYANRVYQKLALMFGAQTLRRQGLTIIVPYDPKIGKAAIRAVRLGVLEIEQRQPYRGPEVHYESEQWQEILEGWSQASADEPTREDEFFPALIENVKRDGRLTVNDGHRQWLLSKPEWEWAPPEDESDKAAAARPRTWKAGDVVLLRGTTNGGVRLIQRPSVEGALYSIDLQRGTVLAQVGGFDYRLGDFDRVSQARRQPGSAFKPFLYATAMDHGFTPAHILMDTPVVFESKELDEFWRPENYKNRFVGPVTLRDALEKSRNLASIKLLQDVGIRRFIRALNNYQFETEFPPQLALALGATEVSLRELTESYAVLASSGQRWQPVAVQQVQDRNGKSLHRSVSGFRCQICHADPVLAVGDNMRPAEQTVNPVSAFLALNMMRGVIERGTGRLARPLRRPAAGKTGTTNDQVDAWFIGFTPQIITGVWVGRDVPSSMGQWETGAHAALPIWLSSMLAFHKGLEKTDFTPPPDIEWVVIDRKTGKRATSTTKEPFLEAFRTGTAPPPEEEKEEKPDDSPKDDAEDFFELGL